MAAVAMVAAASVSAITDFPCVLVETLFISSLREEEMLADPAIRRAMMDCAGFPDSQMPQFVYEDASVQTDGNLAAHLQ